MKSYMPFLFPLGNVNHQISYRLHVEGSENISARQTYRVHVFSTG